MLSMQYQTDQHGEGDCIGVFAIVLSVLLDLR